MTLVVVDTGVINLKNIVRALRYVGASVVVGSDANDVRSADQIVLPGVGSFGAGMAELKLRGLDAALHERASDGVPLLGICLGMQMLFSYSDEGGGHRGLDLIPGSVVRIPSEDSGDRPASRTRKVPHVGWGQLHSPSGRSDWAHSCLRSSDDGDFCYFVHSYMAIPDNSDTIIAYTNYRGVVLNAAIRHNNLTGLQFHPERSGAVGLRILENFVGNSDSNV